MKYFLRVHVKRYNYSALVNCHLHYGILLWGHASQSEVNLLWRIKNAQLDKFRDMKLPTYFTALSFSINSSVHHYQHHLQIICIVYIGHPSSLLYSITAALNNYEIIPDFISKKLLNPNYMYSLTSIINEFKRHIICNYSDTVTQIAKKRKINVR